MLMPERELICALPSMQEAEAYADALNDWAANPPLPGTPIPERVEWEDADDLTVKLEKTLAKIHGPDELWEYELLEVNSRGMVEGVYDSRIDSRAGLDVDLEVNDG
jgi:hypothetical protein